MRRLRPSLSRPNGHHCPTDQAAAIGATGSPVPCQRPRRAHATSTPGTARAARRPPPGWGHAYARLCPGDSEIPRFWCHRSAYRCVSSGSRTFVFSSHTWPA